MLEEGRIPMSETETAEVEKLVKRRRSKLVSLTRRDPGDKGPVLALLADGTTHEIGKDAADG